MVLDTQATRECPLLQFTNRIFKGSNAQRQRHLRLLQEGG